MIDKLRRQAGFGTINQDFTKLTHPPGATADSTAIRSFVRDRGWCAAYLLARDNRRLLRMRDELEWENAVSEVAGKSVQTLLSQLERGALTAANKPIASFAGYVHDIVDGHARDRNRTKTPARIAALGHEAVEMFQRAVVYGEDLEQVQRDLEMRFPASAGALRRQVVPAVINELLRPDPRAKRARRTPIPATDIETPDADRPDLIEDRDVAMGPRHPDPAEELIQSVHHQAVVGAIERLNEPDKSRARAYFLDRSVSGPAEFARTFGVKNGQYEIKKLEKTLAAALAYLAE